ncbi:hypothetical protein [Arthrobacter sp. P2b]|uniref:hypothetical protein n=1 Tax=Arthrobacter sp. P2b TaxID=1938741 RepID=UPI0009A66105|nr:hypothetical protein [Arthrobacter sp. P2b]
MTHPTAPSSAPVHAVKQTGESPIAEEIAHSPAFAAINSMNLFLVRWLHSIASDGSLPLEALAVATVMAHSAGIGRVAFTDWQRINAALGRNRRDLAVFETMSEIALEGYVERDADDLFVYGWTLLIPEDEL